jgi:hypothetical protein
MIIAEEHAAFARQLLDGMFYDLPKQRRMLAVSIIPKYTLVAPLDLLALDDVIRRGLAPLGSLRYDDRFKGTSFANTANEWDNEKVVGIRSVIEIKPSGNLFAAELLHEIELGGIEPRAIEPSREAKIPFYVHEEKFYRAIAEYTRCLASHCQIPQPSFCSISLLNAAGAQFGTTDWWVFKAPSRLVASEIHPPAIEIPSDVSSLDYNAAISRVARLLRPAFDQIWKEAGLPYDPYFDDDGDFMWR